MQHCITLQGVMGMSREENINTTWRWVSLGCSVLTPVMKLAIYLHECRGRKAVAFDRHTTDLRSEELMMKEASE